MKRNNIIWGASLAAVAAGITTYFIRKKRASRLHNPDVSEPSGTESLGEVRRGSKHRTDTFAKAKMDTRDPLGTEKDLI